jgi:hypothetical protein
MTNRTQSALKPWIQPSLAALLIWFTCLPAQAAEYCLQPGKKNEKNPDTVVCCSTPAGWQAWKDEPNYEDRIKRLDPLSKGWLQRLVSFHQPNCKQGPECPYLSLDTRGRDSRGQPDVETGLRELLNESEQLQDLSPRKPPCVLVSRFGSFHIENSGDVTIWQIRCPSGNQSFVSLFAQRDMLVTIQLGGPAIKHLVPKLDSLEELARSVRLTDTSLALPDLVEIDAVGLSDEAIRQQLTQLTPVGTPMERVHEVLEWRFRPKGNQQISRLENLHWVKNDLHMEIDSYPNAGPSATVVEAFWKSDKQHKLREVEIRRCVIEYKSKRAIPVPH